MSDPVRLKPNSVSMGYGFHRDSEPRVHFVVRAGDEAPDPQRWTRQRVEIFVKDWHGNRVAEAHFTLGDACAGRWSSELDPTRR